MEWRRIGCPKNLHSNTGGPETYWKPHVKMEIGSRKRSSSARGEKMERGVDR
jgi:hypothetical protein